MQELAERSGLPKTTIHHYTREGLLPAARKTAPNAAVYEHAHLERLRLISRLRGNEFGGLSIPEVRRVISHVEAGHSVAAAVRLAEEGIAPEAPGDGAGTALEELADAAGLDREFVASLESVGLLPAAEGRDVTAGDMLVARAVAAVCSENGIGPTDLTPLADLVREVGNYSSALVDIHASRHVSSVGSGDTADPPRLGERLAGLCDALLWRALRS